MSSKETNKRWLPVIAACAVLIGVSMWVSALLPTKTEARTAPTTTATSAFPQRLGTYDGRLARFSVDGSVPLEVYDVDVATLPVEEQSRLAAFIAIPDAATLADLLDTYTS